MSQPFIGEIRPFAFGYAPRYWAPCNGQIMPIAQNQALFSILGTTYGGNGVQTFGLPNLQGSVPVHPDSAGTIPLGAVGGSATQSLTVAQIPAHSHIVACKSTPGSASKPNGAVPAGPKLAANAPVDQPYDATADGTMNPQSLLPVGGGAAHNNLQPYIAVNYCIALQGIFPSRS
jgi:microcystin-dependent protein